MAHNRSITQRHADNDGDDEGGDDDDDGVLITPKPDLKRLMKAK